MEQELPVEEQSIEIPQKTLPEQNYHQDIEKWVSTFTDCV